ncbi:acyltransferase family protein [Rhizobium daejeonense]
MKAFTNRIGCLDGLRGIAALWVLVGHAHILSGWDVPVIGDPDLGVDLFVLLSGFLMTFHYQLRRDKEPWTASMTWGSFWIRRLFRIAPLYYVLLLVALASGSFIYESRAVIDAFNGVIPQEPDRYLDSSLTNLLVHMSFVFGFLPEYAFRTALPDWSIGLEMQFYLMFPFLMLLVLRAGWLRAACFIMAAGVAIAISLKVAGIRFPMPSFLPLKLHIFVAGMLLAGGLNSSRKTIWMHFGVASFAVLLPVGASASPLHEAVRLMVISLFFALVYASVLPGRMSKLFTGASEFLGSRFFHYLGEFSYGAYLTHLLIMQPVIAMLIGEFGTEMSAPARFFAALALTIPVVYLLAGAGYYVVEKPGQRMGRLLSKPRQVSVT